MALPDLTGQNIQDTYQRVLQTDNGTLRDGTGSLVDELTVPGTGSFGRVETSGDINASGRVFEQGTSVIDHATAMSIVFGG